MRHVLIFVISPDFQEYLNTNTRIIINFLKVNRNITHLFLVFQCFSIFSNVIRTLEVTRNINAILMITRAESVRRVCVRCLEDDYGMALEDV